MWKERSIFSSRKAQAAGLFVIAWMTLSGCIGEPPPTIAPPDVIATQPIPRDVVEIDTPEQVVATVEIPDVLKTEVPIAGEIFQMVSGMSSPDSAQGSTPILALATSGGIEIIDPLENSFHSLNHVVSSQIALSNKGDLAFVDPDGRLCLVPGVGARGTHPEYDCHEITGDGNTEISHLAFGHDVSSGLLAFIETDRTSEGDISKLCTVQMGDLSQIRCIEDQLVSFQQPSWSADGSFIAITGGGEDGALTVERALIGRGTPFTEGNSLGFGWGAAFSPDAARIAYIREHNGIVSLNVKEIGGYPRPLVVVHEIFSPLSWYKNTHVAFAALYYPESEFSGIYVLRAAPEGSEKLIAITDSFPENNRNPVFVGDKLAFISGRESISIVEVPGIGGD